MKRWLLLIWTMGAGLLAAQTNDSLSGEFEWPEFQMLRANEDYRFLRGRERPRGFLNQVKFLPLGDRSALSWGGDVRLEGQRLWNEDWEMGNHDEALFLRLMLHSDVQLGEHLRLFGQLKSGIAFGRRGPRLSLNEDALGVHQLFAELKLGPSQLALGRQELWYGSRRLLSIREGTNVRQSFDGIRWKWEHKGHRLDLLGFAYNPQELGVFDNRIQTDQLLWGAYYVKAQDERPAWSFDAYYLGVRNDSSTFEAGGGTELRHSLGGRHWGKTERWQFNHEALLQWGQFAGGPIRLFC